MSIVTIRARLGPSYWPLGLQVRVDARHCAMALVHAHSVRPLRGVFLSFSDSGSLGRRLSSMGLPGIVFLRDQVTSDAKRRFAAAFFAAAGAGRSLGEAFQDAKSAISDLVHDQSRFEFIESPFPMEGDDRKLEQWEKELYLKAQAYEAERTAMIDHPYEELHVKPSHALRSYQVRPDNHLRCYNELSKVYALGGTSRKIICS